MHDTSDFPSTQRPEDSVRSSDEGRVAARPDARRVYVMTGMDEAVMAMTAHMLVADDPAAPVVSYRVRRYANDAPVAEGAAGEGLGVFRTVSRRDDAWSAAPDDTVAVPLDGCCLTCTVKRDVLTVLQGMCHAGDAIVVLPGGMEAAPVARYLDESFTMEESFGDDPYRHVGDRAPSRRMRVAAVVDVARTDGLLDRLFDADSFDWSGDVEGYDDGRCVGQAFAALLGEADHVLLLPGGGASTGGRTESHARPEVRSARGDEVAEVVRTLVCVGAQVHGDATAADLDGLDRLAQDGGGDTGDAEAASSETGRPGAEGMPMSHDHAAAHGDESVGADAHTAADWTVATLAPGVVAMSIRTSRPLHPGRLSEFLQREAAPMHIRGRFTVPNKPFSVFAWEADPRGSEIAVVDEVDADASSLGGLDDDGALRDCGVTHDGLAHGGAAYVDAAADGVVSDRLVTADAGESSGTELMVVVGVGHAPSTAGAGETAETWCEALRALPLTDAEMRLPERAWLDQHDAFTTWMTVA